MVVVVLPCAPAVSSPLEFIVATLVLEEVHVTLLVHAAVLLSEYVHVAVNC